MRIQLALNVSDIDEAVAHYSKMFGTEPHKRRPGYANFAIAEPPLKLVLFENPGATERLNHLGVELFEAGDVARAAERLEAAGMLDEVQRETRCCHATQDKAWSSPLDGVRWEFYRILDDNPEPAQEATGTVCCSDQLATERAGAA